MRAPVPFDLNKILREEDGGENDDEKRGPSRFLIEHFGRGYEGGSIQFADTDKPNPVLGIIRDKPHNRNKYFALKNLAHILDAYSKQPKSRRTDAGKAIHAIARILADEFEQTPQPPKADVDSHYTFTVNRIKDAFPALQDLYDKTGLQAAILAAKPAATPESAYITGTLAPLIRAGTEATVLGDTIGNILFQGKGKMRGGLTEEQIKALADKAYQRDLEFKRRDREAKNSARAAPPPARKTKEEEEAEERQRAEAEARQRAAAEAERQRQREADAKRRKEEEDARKAAREAEREAERLREEAERPAKEAEAERRRRANLPLLGLKWSTPPPKMPEDVSWDEKVPKSVTASDISNYNLLESRRGYTAKEIEYLQEVFQDIVDNLVEQGWEIEELPLSAINWVGRENHLAPIDKHWFPRQSKADQDKYMEQRETDADREVARRRAYWEKKGEIPVLITPDGQWAISFTPEYWAEGDIRMEQMGVPRFTTHLIFKKNGDKWDDLFSRVYDPHPGVLHNRYGFSLYKDLLPRAAVWQKLIDDGKYRDPYGSKKFGIASFFGKVAGED